MTRNTGITAGLVETGAAGPGTSESRSNSGSMTVRTISTSEGFDALETSWNGLIVKSEAGIFQTYEWQRTWWQYFGDGMELRILVFSIRGKDVAIAPFCMSRRKLFGIRVARHLSLIGVGLSDYLSLIIATGYESTVLDALAGHLAAHRSEWDVADFEDLNETVPYFRDLTPTLRRKGLPVYRYQGNVSPFFTLPANPGEITQQIGQSNAYNLNRKTKRLHSNFSSNFELIRSESDQIEKGIDDFSFIHGDRWKSQGHPSAFDDPHHRSFHIDVCKKFARRDWLRLYFLRVNDERVAVCLNFNYRSRIFMYQCNAHGPEDVMKCSPGLLLRHFAILEGINEKMQVFDFLRGNETYKYREWKARDTRNWLIRTSSHTTGGRLRFLLFLVAEFWSKTRARIMREYFDYRRHKSSGSSKISTPQFIRGRLAVLFKLSFHYMRRHASPDKGDQQQAGKPEEKP